MTQNKATYVNPEQHVLSHGLMLLVLLISGCSSFDRAWLEAAKTPPPDNSITGRWEGSWLSRVNGHKGKLRAILTETEAETYQARFRATYLGILSFGYTMTLYAKQTEDISTFSGRADLGAMAGGVYQYDGHAGPTEFSCQYTSKNDHGIFEMRRPK